MNRIAIFLRKKTAHNKFRKVILETLRLGIVDNALICSGFFQDQHPAYSAGGEFDVMRHRSASPLELTTLGLYSYSWKQQYSSFHNRLLATNNLPGFAAKKKRIPSMGWHAKLFLAKVGKEPVVAIIGSSNITRRAFGEEKDFNYECDVVFWEEKNAIVNSTVEGAIGDPGDTSDVIVSNYDDNHRANRMGLIDRLKKLELEVLARAIDA